MDNREYKANKIFLIVAVMTLVTFFLLFAFTTSKHILAINESVKANEMYGLESIEESYSSNLKYYTVQLRCTTTYLNGNITFNKGSFRVLTIRDKNTNKLLAIYEPIGELETRERVLLTNVKSIKITDDDVVSNITGAPSKTTEKIEVPVEKYFNIDELVKAYNGKYSNTVLAFEKINKDEYNKFVDSHKAKGYHSIVVLTDFIMPILGAILVATCVYVLYTLMKGDKIHL